MAPHSPIPSPSILLAAAARGVVEGEVHDHAWLLLISALVVLALSAPVVGWCADGGGRGPASCVMASIAEYAITPNIL